MIRPLLLLLLTFLPLNAHAETILLMAEEDGCYWCARWNKEIGPIYPKTAEGKVAPLHRYDLGGAKPNVTFKQRVHYTPTFILVRDGVELDRIEGYPGEDFFWGLLTMMLDRSGISLEHAG